MSTPSAEEKIVLRQPTLSDGLTVHQLIQNSPPLDCNSPYSYFLLCSHFSASCVVAEYRGDVVGFLSAYLRPDAPRTLFVWQVVVDTKVRQRGVALQMLENLLSRPLTPQVEWIETTVGPSNRASLALFNRFAQSRKTTINQSTFLSAEDFGGESHETELLLRIGPLTASSSSPPLS